MKEINVTGQKRENLGKKASKELRKQGLIPCNIYGEKKGENGLPEAYAFAIPFTELRKIIYTPHIYVIDIDIEGVHRTAILKEIQFHPVTDAPLPVKLVGLAQGVRDGGRMNISIRKINVTAPYQQIPEHLDVDVTKLRIGKSIKVGQLSYEGIEIATGKEVIVCSIKMTRNAVASAASDSDETEE